jgi:hypothetical protein
VTEISNHQRRTILLAIEAAIPANRRRDKPDCAPRYPDSVPDIRQHIDALIQFIQIAEHPTRSPAERIRAGICSQCPHQFPERYCPLRQSGGCIPFRFAEPIAEAISNALADAQ